MAVVAWHPPTDDRAAVHRSVIEALAVGWVDSKPGKLDDERTMLYFTRRKPGSGWSRPNKIRVEALSRNGLLTDVAKDMIERAKRDGSWSLLDDVEDLFVPPDLSDRFDVHPGSQANWESFPPSARRGILESIVQAKRPATRAQRIDETARLAALNQRANQWQRRG